MIVLGVRVVKRGVKGRVGGLGLLLDEGLVFFAWHQGIHALQLF